MNIKKAIMEIGTLVTCKNQGVYKVIAKQPNSRTLFEIEDVDKGKGWCEATKKYIGVSVKNGWYRGNNLDYGNKIIRHIKHLKIIVNEEV
jgi:hypothetical protein